MYYSKKLTNCYGNMKKTWGVINDLLNKNRKNDMNHGEFKLNHTTFTDPNIISEKFNQYFINVGEKLANQF